MNCRQLARRDKSYRDSFRDRACESCGRQDDTIVPAHNRRGHTGGMGYKPPDYLVAALCASCHALDTEGTREERNQVWDNVLANLLEDLWTRNYVLNILMKDRYLEWKER